MSSTEDGGGGGWEEAWVSVFPVGTGSGGSWSGCGDPVRVFPGGAGDQSRCYLIQVWESSLCSEFGCWDPLWCSRLNVGIFTEFLGGVVGVLSGCSGFALEADPGESGPGVGIFLSSELGRSLAWQLETHPVYVARCGGSYLGVQGLGLEPALVAAWVLFGSLTLSLA